MPHTSGIDSGGNGLIRNDVHSMGYILAYKHENFKLKYTISSNQMSIVFLVPDDILL